MPDTDNVRIKLQVYVEVPNDTTHADFDARLTPTEMQLAVTWLVSRILGAAPPGTTVDAATWSFNSGLGVTEGTATV